MRFLTLFPVALHIELGRRANPNFVARVAKGIHPPMQGCIFCVHGFSVSSVTAEFANKRHWVPSF